MTLDASTPPTAVTPVAAVLRLPVVFGAEVHWDFPVAPADKTDSTESRFHRARRGTRWVQSKAIAMDNRIKRASPWNNSLRCVFEHLPQPDDPPLISDTEALAAFINN